MTTTDINYWVLVFICSFVAMGCVYMVWSFLSEGWRILWGILKRGFGPTTVVFLVMALMGVMVLVHYQGLITKKGEVVDIRQKIKENTDAFFKLIEKEPVVRRRTKNDWDERPEASYFRYQEYLKKEERVGKQIEERVKSIKLKAEQIHDLLWWLRFYSDTLADLIEMVEDSDIPEKTKQRFLDRAEKNTEKTLKRINSFKPEEQGEKK